MTKKSSKASASPEKKKKEYKLDLFGQVLPALYRCDFDFYSRCSDEERKEISLFMLLRWLSLSTNAPEVTPLIINSANTYFWLLSDHPELQWKQLCCLASELSRRTPRHEWFGMKKKKTATPLLDNYLMQRYPLASDAELGIVKEKFAGEDDVRDLAEQFGATDAEIKNVVKEYRGIYGKKDTE